MKLKEKDYVERFEELFSVYYHCLFFVQPLMAEDGRKGDLVDVNWLEKNLNSEIFSGFTML